MLPDLFQAKRAKYYEKEDIFLFWKSFPNNNKTRRVFPLDFSICFEKIKQMCPHHPCGDSESFIFFPCGSAAQRGSWPPHSWGFLYHTQRGTIVGRTALDEWSTRRRDLYLTIHNNHNRQTSMPPAGFEPTISAGERPQTYALDRAATGTGFREFSPSK